MPVFLKSRWEFWREVWAEVRHGREAQIIGALYATALSIYGVLSAFAPTLVERAHKMPAFATLLSFRVWLIVALCIALGLILEGAYRVIDKKEKAHKIATADLARELDSAGACITGKIKEVYFSSWRYDGLHVTMLVVITNRRTAVTIQDYRATYEEESNGKEYMGESVDVEDYSIVRKEQSPSFLVRRESWERLHSLRDLDLVLLDQNTHREGWLRFRMSKLPYSPTKGEVTLEILDALEKVHQIKISAPWPQNGYISLTSRLDEIAEAAQPKKERKKPAKKRQE
jgi:hypothetical protein